MRCNNGNGISVGTETGQDQDHGEDLAGCAQCMDLAEANRGSGYDCHVERVEEAISLYQHIAGNPQHNDGQQY